MPFFQHDEILFNYYDDKKNALPLLFLHGLGSDLKQSTSLLQNSESFRLLSLDFRGHGKTYCSPNPTQFTISTYANDVLHFLDFLKIEQVIIGGISLGAAVALNFAIRSPQRVHSLILVRPAWLNLPEPPNLTFFPFIGTLLQGFGVTQGLEIWQQSIEYRTIMEESIGAANALSKQFIRTQAEKMATALIQLPRSASFQDFTQLHRLQFPTLLVGNYFDPLHPLAFAEVLADALPNSFLKIAPPRYLEPESHSESVRDLIVSFSVR